MVGKIDDETKRILKSGLLRAAFEKAQEELRNSPTASLELDVTALKEELRITKYELAEARALLKSAEEENERLKPR